MTKKKCFARLRLEVRDSKNIFTYQSLCIEAFGSRDSFVMPYDDYAILQMPCKRVHIIHKHCIKKAPRTARSLLIRTFVIPLSSSSVVAPSMRPLRYRKLEKHGNYFINAAYQAKAGRVFSIVWPRPPRCAYDLMNTVISNEHIPKITL